MGLCTWLSQPQLWPQVVGDGKEVMGCITVLDSAICIMKGLDNWVKCFSK